MLYTAPKTPRKRRNDSGLAPCSSSNHTEDQKRRDVQIIEGDTASSPEKAAAALRLATTYMSSRHPGIFHNREDQAHAQECLNLAVLYESSTPFTTTTSPITAHRVLLNSMTFGNLSANIEANPDEMLTLALTLAHRYGDKCTAYEYGRWLLGISNMINQRECQLDTPLADPELAPDVHANLMESAIGMLLIASRETQDNDDTAPSRRAVKALNSLINLYEGKNPAHSYMENSEVLQALIQSECELGNKAAENQAMLEHSTARRTLFFI